MNIIKCALQAGGIGIWKCWFLWREENRRTRRKTLGARTRTNKKLNPHDTGTGNRTWATLVEDECSHHCAIPAPLLFVCQVNKQLNNVTRAVYRRILADIIVFILKIEIHPINKQR